jgi:hypothetical protein
MAKLSAHHFGTADLLVQRGLADDKVNLRLMLDQDRLLPSHDRLYGAVTGGLGRQSRVGVGQGAGVGRGLQEGWDALCLVGPDTGGCGFQEQVVLPRPVQQVVVVAVPAERAARVC